MSGTNHTPEATLNWPLLVLGNSVLKLDAGHIASVGRVAAFSLVGRPTTMRPFKSIIAFTALQIVLTTCVVRAAELPRLLPELKQGGYVLVVRHVATDDSQKDVYPFAFDDMKKQRQLSEEGRKFAREMGGAMKALGIRLDQVYTSKLNRAIETGSLLSGIGGNSVSELTDSGAGSASAMANPSGSNSKVGSAIRSLVNRMSASGTNNLLVTHKTNIVDAFGKSFSDVKEGEALIYKPDPSGLPNFVGRIRADEWVAQASASKS
jgi:phosphohistidine phosphatase SixA